MSDNFEMLVDVDATAEEAAELARAVLERFHTLGLISGDPNGDCVPGGQGYRPGSAVADLYKRQTREGRFWELLTCGVEPLIGRGLNEWALGPVCEGFTCSACGAEIEPFGNEFGDSVGKAIGEWYDQSGAALLECPQCAHKRSITDWCCKPPLAFGNLAFRFWNWPPLDSPSWSIDLATIVREVTSHRVVSTHGHM